MTRLYEASRPCPQCGRDVDLTNVKPGGQTFCRNKESHPGKAVVLRRRLVPPPWRAEVAAAEAEAATNAANRPAGWDTEPPGVLDWRAQLGPECPAAEPCDDTCDCGGPPIRYTLDHTGTACPGCGPECWDVTPGAFDRGRKHAQARAAVARVASTPAAQSELDQRDRELERARARLLAVVAAGLEIKRISADSISDLQWFARAIEQAEAPARLQQLAADLAGYTVGRDRWWRPEGTISELATADDDDEPEPDDYDQDEDDDAAELAPVAGYIAPVPNWRGQTITYPGPPATVPMCARCGQARSVVRIRYNEARTWDACPSCAAILTRPMAGITSEVIHRYPAGGTWTDDDYQREAQRRLASQQRPALTRGSVDAS